MRIFNTYPQIIKFVALLLYIDVMRRRKENKVQTFSCRY